MKLFILVILLILIVILLKRIKNKSGFENNEIKIINKNVLSEVEQVMYWRLKEAVGNEKQVMCQVAFSSFLKPEKYTKEGLSKFARARQKVADFVICNKDFSVNLIIEIDDKSHSSEKDEKRDEITKEAGIRTIRFNVKKLPSVDELKKELI